MSKRDFLQLLQSYTQDELNDIIKQKGKPMKLVKIIYIEKDNKISKNGTVV